MKKILLPLALLLLAFSAHAQLMNKIQQIFMDDIFFVQLKEIHNKVQGEEGKAIPLFLEKTMANPTVISLEKFRSEKKRYYDLCGEFNGIIEDIVTTIQGLDKLKDLREVNLLQYRSRIDAVGPKFDALFRDLSQYHQEASIVSILFDIYKLGKPIIQHLIQEKIETIQRVLVVQLRSLKLTPLAWEPAEAVVAQRAAPGSREEIRAKIGLAATDHYRSINLAPGVTPAQIQDACTILKADYAAEINGTSNPEIKEFFTQLTDRVEAARKYFEANPPVAPKAVNEAKAVEGNGDNSRTNAALKAELEGLLRGAKYMTKEQLMEELEGVLKKY